MPDMISLRKFNLPTTTGHMISFLPNIPVYVADAAVPAALAAGCVPADESQRPIFDDLARTRMEFSGDIRKSILHMAIAEVMEENDIKKFDGSGQPKPEIISDRLGFPVLKDERRIAWELYVAAKKEGIEVPLHKDAAKVLEIVDAETKAELLILAEDCGVPTAQAKGLTVKDLRKLLLARFSGLTNA